MHLTKFFGFKREDKFYLQKEIPLNVLALLVLNKFYNSTP